MSSEPQQRSPFSIHFMEDTDICTGSPDPDATEPSGLSLHYADGTVTECALVHDPEPDEDGRDRWIAVPPPGMPLPRVGDTLVIDVMPPGTGIYFTR